MTLLLLSRRAQRGPGRARGKVSNRDRIRLAGMRQSQSKVDAEGRSRRGEAGDRWLRWIAFHRNLEAQQVQGSVGAAEVGRVRPAGAHERQQRPRAAKLELRTAARAAAESRPRASLAGSGSPWRTASRRGPDRPSSTERAWLARYRRVTRRPMSSCQWMIWLPPTSRSRLTRNSRQHLERQRRRRRFLHRRQNGDGRVKASDERHRLVGAGVHLEPRPERAALVARIHSQERGDVGDRRVRDTRDALAEGEPAGERPVEGLRDRRIPALCARAGRFAAVARGVHRKLVRARPRRSRTIAPTRRLPHSSRRRGWR